MSGEVITRDEEVFGLDRMDDLVSFENYRSRDTIYVIEIQEKRLRIFRVRKDDGRETGYLNYNMSHDSNSGYSDKDIREQDILKYLGTFLGNPKALLRQWATSDGND